MGFYVFSLSIAKGLYVEVGFSGHSFKLLPTVEESLAQQVFGNESRIPIEIYDMTHFETGKTSNRAYDVGIFA